MVPNETKAEGREGRSKGSVMILCLSRSFAFHNNQKKKGKIFLVRTGREWSMAFFSCVFERLCLLTTTVVRSWRSNSLEHFLCVDQIFRSSTAVKFVLKCVLDLLPKCSEKTRHKTERGTLPIVSFSLWRMEGDCSCGGRRRKEVSRFLCGGGGGWGCFFLDLFQIMWDVTAVRDITNACERNTGSKLTSVRGEQRIDLPNEIGVFFCDDLSKCLLDLSSLIGMMVRSIVRAILLTFDLA